MGLTLDSAIAKDSTYYAQKAEAERLHGKMTNREFEESFYVPAGSGGGLSDTGTSVFDPVLCELSYAWYSREGDRILDPFAGGSVRGVVASVMGRRYTGVELRPEQVAANAEQGRAICAEQPVWITGDSAHLDELVPDDGYDMLLTCPPYGDLEVYSDDPADISTMDPDGFREAYGTILRKAVAKLADDRFAVIVIGDARGRDGMYYSLPGMTVDLMTAAGARYYNEAILVTPVGSLPIRVGRQFEASRKLGKTHQNVLTFVKGDPKAATARLGSVVVPDL